MNCIYAAKWLVRTIFSSCKKKDKDNELLAIMQLMREEIKRLNNVLDPTKEGEANKTYVYNLALVSMGKVMDFDASNPKKPVTFLKEKVQMEKQLGALFDLLLKERDTMREENKAEEKAEMRNNLMDNVSTDLYDDGDYMSTDMMQGDEFEDDESDENMLEADDTEEETKKVVATPGKDDRVKWQDPEEEMDPKELEELEGDQAEPQQQILAAPERIKVGIEENEELIEREEDILEKEEKKETKKKKR
ncbi:hypothetical protein Ciccas_013073 [Cichlidogyrus casuarinus]|uniref:Uncharacterized protein n=1 Tax=Cichlidogyrus casuarinus TaxID=1844966 RepID=A0ABD2PPM4_9PLAT